MPVSNPFQSLLNIVNTRNSNLPPTPTSTVTNRQQKQLAASLLTISKLGKAGGSATQKSTWEKLNSTGPRKSLPVWNTPYRPVTPKKVVLPPIMAGINTPYNPATDAGGGGGGGYSGYGGYGGGGGGGGTTGAPPVAPLTWSEFDSGVKDKPSWWKALKPSTVDSGTEYLASLNMMIPFLSPEDQKVVANTLYQQDANTFGHLAPDKIGNLGYQATPNQYGEYGVSAADQAKFTSADRAKNALAALAKFAEATGKTAADLGPGYKYLQSLLASAQEFGGANGEAQSRRQAQQMLSAMDPMLAQTQTGDMSVYGPLARMLANPFFSAGQLTPVQRTSDGTYVFGTPNKGYL